MASLYQLTSNFLEVDNLIEEYLQAGEEDLADNLVKANQIIAKEIENKSVGFIYVFRNMDSQVYAIDAKLPEKAIIPGTASPKQKNMILALAGQKDLFSFDTKKDTNKMVNYQKLKTKIL